MCTDFYHQACYLPLLSGRDEASFEEGESDALATSALSKQFQVVDFPRA